MLDKNAVQNIKAAIRTLSKTAMQALSVYDPEEYGADLAEEMENTAQAVCRYYELDDSVMQEYRETVNSARRQDVIASRMVDFHDADQAQELIYAVCDGLDAPKDIMYHVRTATDMMNLCFAERLSS